MSVVADGHAGQMRLAAADHVPARGDQMHPVPQRRRRDRPVRIVRQQRLPRQRLGAADHPVVAALVPGTARADHIGRLRVRRPVGWIHDVLRRELDGLARRQIVAKHIVGNRVEGDSIRNLQFGAARMQVQQHPNRVGRHAAERLGDQHLGFQIEKDAADAGYDDLRRPRLGHDPQQPELHRQCVGRVQRVLNGGVDAVHERGDDRFAVRVVIGVLALQVAAKAQQPSADVAVQSLRPLNLGQTAQHPPAPYFELKQAVARRVVALREEQVVLILGVDMRDTPAVGQDFDGRLQTGDVEGFHSVLPDGVRMGRGLCGRRGRMQERERAGTDQHEQAGDEAGFRQAARRASGSGHVRVRAASVERR